MVIIVKLLWYKQNKSLWDMMLLGKKITPHVCITLPHCWLFSHSRMSHCVLFLTYPLSKWNQYNLSIPHSILNISSTFELHWLRAVLTTIYSCCWESWRPFSSSTASALLIHNSVVPCVTPYSQGHSVGGSVSSHSLSPLSIFSLHFSSDTRTGQIPYLKPEKR